MKRAYQELKYLCALLAIIVTSTYFYLGSNVGPEVNFDDAFYIAAIISPFSFLKTLPWSVASFGFFVFGRPFYLFTHNLFATAKAMPISAVILTTLAIYMIGRKYGSRIMGIASAIFFAFNPIVYAYSMRVLPDIFITMLFSYALLIVIYFKRANYAYFLGGIIITLGIFFGLQVFLSLLAYLVFVISFAYIVKAKDIKKKIFYTVLGIGLVVLAFSLLQELLYNDPLLEIRGFESFNAKQEIPHNNFYLYAIMPIDNVSKFTVAKNAGPYPTIGILLLVFICANLLLLFLRKTIILPYTFAFTALIVYANFGSASLTSYMPITQLSRLLLPAVLLGSIGSGLVALQIKRKAQAVALFAFLIFYIGISSFYYKYVITYYNSANKYPYLATKQMSAYLNRMNLRGYTIYDNVTLMSVLLCVSLNSTPAGCIGSSLPNSIYCYESNTILLLNTPYCGNDYAFSNKSLGYYIYVNK